MPKLTVNQLAAFTLVMNIFLLPACFFSSSKLQTPCIKRENSRSLTFTNSVSGT